MTDEITITISRALAIRLERYAIEHDEPHAPDQAYEDAWELRKKLLEAGDEVVKQRLKDVFYPNGRRK